eukprot:750997-Hanusia_phi.AAC.2
MGLPIDLISSRLVSSFPLLITLSSLHFSSLPPPLHIICFPQLVYPYPLVPHPLHPVVSHPTILNMLHFGHKYPTLSLLSTTLCLGQSTKHQYSSPHPTTAFNLLGTGTKLVQCTGTHEQPTHMYPLTTPSNRRRLPPEHHPPLH